MVPWHRQSGLSRNSQRASNQDGGEEEGRQHSRSSRRGEGMGQLSSYSRHFWMDSSYLGHIHDGEHLYMDLEDALHNHFAEGGSSSWTDGVNNRRGEGRPRLHAEEGSSDVRNLSKSGPCRCDHQRLLRPHHRDPAHRNLRQRALSHQAWGSAGWDRLSNID